MSTASQKEKLARTRVVALFRETLGHRYRGHWIAGQGDATIKPELLSRRGRLE